MVKKWIPALLWMVAIFVLSNQPKGAIPSFGLWDFLVKKGSHFLAYGLLAGLYWWALRGGKRPFPIAFLLTFLYAVSDEWHQSFIPGRNATVMDVMIDSVGGLVMLGLLYFWQLRRQPTYNKADQAASEF
ncbi:MAG: VanZ family protein [Anaerolineales bacterium]|nr:VanZ family protein [Anaerolineales bacterium]MCB8966545.1 VanZ family protein [Ardenticatenaceae bacterium]